ncbi:MarR family transcriptional regulator [Corynebacterium callunae]|uniref:MarR family winged helix-turn-helix transcriptional regulator n=1 Tax=Corynebacterium callunae TaxID=1721 RepID=UPI0039829CF0
MPVQQDPQQWQSISQNLFDVNSSDPNSEIVDRSSLSHEEIAQIGRVMKSLGDLRNAERAVAEASEKYMKLSSQDMRALHYLIVAKHRDEVVTPGMLGQYLSLSPASITKLLNRLEKGGHIIREVHPFDRRAFAIEVTPSTRNSAMQTVGKQHAKRFQSAARLTSAEREIVIKFFEDMNKELSLEDVDWSEPSSH